MNIFRSLRWCLVLFPLLAYAANNDPTDFTQRLNLTPPDTDLSIGYLEAIFGTVAMFCRARGPKSLRKCSEFLIR